MMLFFVGLIEMIVATIWTRFVSRGQLFASGGVTFVNILIWYYVLQQIITDMSNMTIVLLYAAGCATGTMLTLFVSNKIGQEKNSRVVIESLPDSV